MAGIPRTIRARRASREYGICKEEQLIDGFVKAIIVYLTYTDEPIDMPTTEEIEFMDQSSDIASAVSPKNNTTLMVVLFFAAWESPPASGRSFYCGASNSLWHNFVIPSYKNSGIKQ